MEDSKAPSQNQATENDQEPLALLPLPESVTHENVDAFADRLFNWFKAEKGE